MTYKKASEYPETAEGLWRYMNDRLIRLHMAQRFLLLNAKWDPKCRLARVLHCYRVLDAHIEEHRERMADCFDGCPC